MEYTREQYFHDMYISGYFGRLTSNVREFVLIQHNLELDYVTVAWGMLLPVEIAEFTRRYEEFIQPHGVENKKEIQKPVVIHTVSERKRKLATPVYPMTRVDYKDCRLIWDPRNNDCKSYGNKSTSARLTSRLFKNCLLIKDEYYRNNMSLLMNNINKHLINIYNAYSTFNDFDNLAAHIVFMGIEYYQRVVANPSIIIPTLVSEDYVKLWDIYVAAI